ncbi:PAS domain S-box protein [Saccharibacillus sp. CPCC 101409]|uniref:PAS domain-containing hybrid sensor histidine kinase/response regulator n=1 Tax=Saccharibacillus sp. CPCC 101409 TaxID=3058041 RepID=UPI0026722C61|nr:PAS domain-containing hybrid sensor histidine kinase/response regulator [Saccharibacillus sp. CPCC 101409]MDO3408821.1 PAS domain S-box protein [Saccharibacillus sp. CPCC 101409]
MKKSFDLLGEMFAESEVYRPLFVHHPDAIYVMNMAGKLVYANPATERITGYTLEELQTLDVKRMYPAGEREQSLSRRGAMEAESRLEFNLRILHKNGTPLTLSVTYVAIEQDGRRVGIYGIAKDVTEQERKSRMLREQERLYRSLFDYNPAGILSFDPRGRCLSANPNVEALTGYTARELERMDSRALVPEEAAESLALRFERTLQGASDNFESQLLAKDGQRVDVNVTSLPIVVDEQVVGIYMIALDITGWKRQMQRSRELTGQYNAILNAVSEGIYELNAEGRSVFINSAGARMLGYETEEFNDMYNHELIHHSRSDGSPYPVEECPIHRAMREGVSCSVEGEVFWRKDGTSILVEYRVNPLFENGRPCGAVVVFKNTTSRSEILRQKEADLRGVAVRTELLSLMSHEIRTPLNGVLGMTELMLGTELTEDQRDFMEVLMLSGRGLQAVVDRVLDFNAAESGAVRFESEPFDAGALIAEAAESFAIQAEAAGLELRWRLDNRFPDRLIGDAGKLRGILVGLIGNAVKFTPRGSVEVTAECLSRPPAESGAGQSRCVLKVEVRDTGIGIPSDKMDMLFQPFTQIHSALDRKYEGTGLGLAICKRWIERMGGTIWAESREGAGSAFSFTLPMLCE